MKNFKEGKMSVNAGFPVLDIFESIQGEGAMLGMPVTFIRFAGCNLNCPWCDTKESWKMPNFDDYTKLVEDTVPNTFSEEEVKQMGLDYSYVFEKLGYAWYTAEELADLCSTSIVVLTGGEPLVRDIQPLVKALHEKDKYVCIETNGTLTIPDNLIDWVVCSPKPPKYEIKPGNLERISELKYVVDDNFTIEAIPSVLRGAELGCIWLQPCDYGKGREAETENSARKAYELVMQHHYLRMGIQMHKLFDLK